MKECRSCHNVKELTDFHKNKAASDGHLNNCKACIKIRNAKDYMESRGPKQREWYRNNKEAVAQKRRDYIATPKNKVRLLINAAKERNKRKGLAFDITADDLLIPTHCPYLGIELVYNKSVQNGRDSATLDKIVPALGYTKGNVQIVSHLANSMKQDATSDELVAFAKAILARLT